MSVDQLIIRRAQPIDRPSIIAVCQESLGWRADDPNEAFFSWKHDLNGFGESPMWVAEDADGEMLGVRAFLRWRFRDTHGNVIRAVRAVDTATTPAAQGRGIFKRLTLGAIPDLAEDGVDVVFNTPNDKSRPGYLKMGWNDVGRVPVAVRVRSPLTVHRLAGANTSALKWSRATTFGEPASAVFADVAYCDRLLASAPAPTGIGTDRDAAYLGWRYSFEPLHYRVLRVASPDGEGAIVFRIRQRGSATEVTICDVIGPPGLRVRRAFGRILRGTGGDYLVVASSPRSPRDLCVPVRQLGPRLTWRSVNRAGTPALSDLALTVGDVELF